MSATYAPPSDPPRKTMSITQTYFLAHKARAKLSSQAARPDHNLRLLVGHANLLDTLMLELADAEREQESWFNQSVRGASKGAQQTTAAAAAQTAAPTTSTSTAPDRHVQWADADWPVEDVDESDSDSDASSDASSDYSDSDEEEDEEDDIYDELSPASSAEDAADLRRVPSHKVEVREIAADDLDDDDDDEASLTRLTLTRSPSHAPLPSPPGLLEEDSDASSLSDDDDEAAMPPSPPAVALQAFATKQPPAGHDDAGHAADDDDVDDNSHDDDDAAFADSTAHYYLPPRNPARLVAALSAY